MNLIFSLSAVRNLIALIIAIWFVLVPIWHFEIHPRKHKTCAGNQTGRIGPATGGELKKRGQGYPFPGAGFRQNLRPIRPLRLPHSKALYRERRRNSGERPASPTSVATVVGSYPIDTPSLPAHELTPSLLPRA
ncbi:hypothetical protein NL676_007185 [Syzygium grande]|nr:hypothetical protein NL676_007185 [Syzygium grande]